MGYTDSGAMTVDSTWTSATTVALEAWQTAVGMTVDGSLAVGDVLFLPGAQRIGTAPTTATVGCQPATWDTHAVNHRQQRRDHGQR